VDRLTSGLPGPNANADQAPELLSRRPEHQIPDKNERTAKPRRLALPVRVGDRKVLYMVIVTM
jgi:hypothetical protein